MLRSSWFATSAASRHLKTFLVWLSQWNLPRYSVLCSDGPLKKDVVDRLSVKDQQHHRLLIWKSRMVEPHCADRRKRAEFVLQAARSWLKIQLITLIYRSIHPSTSSIIQSKTSRETPAVLPAPLYMAFHARIYSSSAPHQSSNVFHHLVHGTTPDHMSSRAL